MNLTKMYRFSSRTNCFGSDAGPVIAGFILWSPMHSLAEGSHISYLFISHILPFILSFFVRESCFKVPFLSKNHNLRCLQNGPYAFLCQKSTLFSGSVVNMPHHLHLANKNDSLATSRSIQIVLIYKKVTWKKCI